MPFFCEIGNLGFYIESMDLSERSILNDELIKHLF